MRKTCLVLVIVAVAAFLRLWQLGLVPPSPDWDEAALGYNAYSIAKTGRDEYGEFLPIVLRSFDDYKPALYAYITIPSILLFGLNTPAVRFPSAIFGILTIIATYFLIKELFKDDALKIKFRKWEIGLPEITALLLAISPWHLQFSRIAFESNVGLAFNIFAALFFLKGLLKTRFLFISAFFASMGLYTYQSEKIFTPLLILALVIIYRQKLSILSKKHLTAILLFLLATALPLVNYTLTNKSALTRARGVSVFADQTPFLQRNAQKVLRDWQNKDYLGLLLDNRRIQYVQAGVNGYLSHFDLNWLFVTGDEIRHHAPFMGLLYIWELPFMLLGIYKLVYAPINKQAKFVIFSWFLITPIPASITSEVPHAVRTLNFLPIFQIFIAIGILSVLMLLHSIKTKLYRYSVALIIFLFVIFNFVYYIDQYFVQQNYFYSQNWQYGYKEAIEEVIKVESRYEKIVVANKPYLDQSYVFFLFYLQYNPQIYQATGKTVSKEFAQNHKSFGKFTFRPINWDNEEKNNKILYVGRANDFPQDIKVLKNIYYLNGEPAIKIVSGG